LRPVPYKCSKWNQENPLYR